MPRGRFWMVLSVTALALLGWGCAKEYSYEQRPADSTATPLPPTEVPFLTSCTVCGTGPLPDQSWRFSVGRNLFCGTVTRAIINLERTAFTFFGPSTCSADSGAVFTVYLSDTLNRDKKNIAAGYTAFYYYDGITSEYLLISRAGVSFSLIVDEYRHAEQWAVGRFQGVAFAKDGQGKQVMEGRFNIRFN